MKLIIELPQNYVEAYREMLPYLDDSITLEQSIAQDSREFVQRVLYQGWEMLDPEFKWPSTRAEPLEQGKDIAARIILKHKIPKEE